MKEALRRMARLAPVRGAVRLVLVVFRGVSRLASVLRAAAIFGGDAVPICHWSVTVKYPENITFGKKVVIGPKTTLGGMAGISFGDYVRVSEGVLIETASLDFLVPPPYPNVGKPIVIESNVWVGARAIILAGVTIGEESVIGAGAVVTQSVPPRTVVIGPQNLSLPKRALPPRLFK